jgi:phosphoglycolate phosphatase-like HAD superfamily hydrolase
MRHRRALFQRQAPPEGQGAARQAAGLSVIFDPESLLLDPAPGIEYAMRWAMRDLGIEVPRQWFERNWTVRTPFWETLTQLMETSDPELIEFGRERYFAHFNECGRFRCTLRPGSMQLLAALASDPRLELHYLTHIGAERAVRLLDAYGLSHIPRVIVAPEAPACPGLRLSLMKQHVEHGGRPRGGWALLSDHPWELMAARRMGLRAVGIGYARLSLDSLCALRPDAIAATPAEVHACLGGQALQEQALCVLHGPARVH